MSGLSVALVAGGPSTEAAVSRTSARSAAAALVEAGHQVAVLELDADLAGLLRARRYDVVFPVTHGAVGEDGCLQGLLEVLGLPYVGSGVLASALAANKPEAKALFGLAGLPIAAGATLHRGDDLAERARVLRAELGPALVVKPAAGGSSIGVVPIRAEDGPEVLVEALERVFELDERALVEAWLVGAEVTCGVLDDEAAKPRALPPTQIVSKAAAWYEFQSKYGPGGSEHLCPAPFAQPVLSRIQELAVRAHRALGARDLSRVDFVVGDGPAAVTLLEVNTLPGFTATSLFPEAAAVAGLSFPALCDHLVRLAHARPRRTAPPVMPMPAA